jgi:nucleoside-diphosphate-sugar epimerase
MSKLIFGCGYLGERVARRWRDAGEEVVVVTRKRVRADEFQRQGYCPIVADVTKKDTLPKLPLVQSVLFAVGHDRSAEPSMQDVYVGGMRNVLAVLPFEIDRFIYISTTGVYGRTDGGWVDEATPPDPIREGGRASLAAEQTLANHPLGGRSVILRLAGIYGAGRVPFIDKLRTGEPIPAPAAGYLNLIHVDDAAEVVLAADRLAHFEDGPRIYCASDGAPVERGEYYSDVARQIGAPPPRFVEPDPESPRTARAMTDRRISNARMLADMRVKLAYPNYRDGLAAVLETRNQ